MSVVNYIHQPVLLDETMERLVIHPNGTYIDLTFGQGGHSKAILNRLESRGRLIAVDKDPAAVRVGEKPPFVDSRFTIHHRSFVELTSLAATLGVLGQVSGLLLDLGISSVQLDDPNRGFSFREKGPLDMRMNPTESMDAATWLNQAAEGDIARVIRQYGEERYARRIAAAIVGERQKTPLTMTQQLAALVSRVVPTREHKHPATRVFQAIRIKINNELQALEHCLQQSIEVLAEGGRIVVISFHSLEDRIVKRFFQQQSKGDQYPPELPVTKSFLQPQLKIIGGLVRPSTEELQRNNRARSARLRVAEKI